jgi:hypothetical protein
MTLEEQALICGEALDLTTTAGEHILHVQGIIVQRIINKNLPKYHPAKYNSLEDMLTAHLDGSSGYMQGQLGFFMENVLNLPEVQAIIVAHSGKWPSANNIKTVMPGIRKAIDSGDHEKVAELMEEAANAPNQASLQQALSPDPVITIYAHKTGPNSWRINGVVDNARMQNLRRVPGIQIEQPAR